MIGEREKKKKKDSKKHLRASFPSERGISRGREKYRDSNFSNEERKNIGPIIVVNHRRRCSADTDYLRQSGDNVLLIIVASRWGFRLPLGRIRQIAHNDDRGRALSRISESAFVIENRWHIDNTVFSLRFRSPVKINELCDGVPLFRSKCAMFASYNSNLGKKLGRTELS